MIAYNSGSSVCLDLMISGVIISFEYNLSNIGVLDKYILRLIGVFCLSNINLLITSIFAFHLSILECSSFV